MEQRLNIMEVGKDAFGAVFGLSKYMAKATIEKPLLHLIELRVSQINGCAYCIDMHSKDLRHEGETEQRLYMLSAWRETPLYTDRERAALEWAEAVTLVADSHVPDDVYDRVKQHFTETELFDLTFAVGAINLWNRFNVAFRTTPGTYQPGQFAAVAS
jgi:AhpD family alkylhydroperoxidase